MAEVLPVMPGDPLAEAQGGQVKGTTASTDNNPGDESPLYQSTEFRLFCFKVLPCSKRFVHDWTVCPFAHPGEKAKRRDPRVFTYTGVACPEMKKNLTCPRGDSCPYAHNVFEYWMHPSRYRTQLCNDGVGCRRKVCFFAHTLDELRVSSVKVMPMDEANGATTSGAGGFELDPFSNKPSNGGRLQRAGSGSGSGGARNGGSSVSPELQQLALLQQLLGAQLQQQAQHKAAGGGSMEALMAALGQMRLGSSSNLPMTAAATAAAASATQAAAGQLSPDQLADIVNIAVQQVMANSAAQQAAQAAAALTYLTAQQNQAMAQQELLQSLVASGMLQAQASQLAAAVQATPFGSAASQSDPSGLQAAFTALVAQQQQQQQQASMTRRHTGSHMAIPGTPGHDSVPQRHSLDLGAHAAAQAAAAGMRMGDGGRGMGGAWVGSAPSHGGFMGGHMGHPHAYGYDGNGMGPYGGGPMHAHGMGMRGGHLGLPPMGPSSLAPQPPSGMPRASFESYTSELGLGAISEHCGSEHEHALPGQHVRGHGTRTSTESTDSDAAEARLHGYGVGPIGQGLQRLSGAAGSGDAAGMAKGAGTLMLPDSLLPHDPFDPRTITNPFHM